MFHGRVLIIFSIMLIVGCGESNPSTIYDGKAFEEPTQDEILTAINKARSQKVDCGDGLGYVGPSQPLSWNKNLYESAYEHSNDLAMSDTFSHNGSGTQYDITGYNKGKQSIFSERIQENGYNEYNIIGENIAGGYGDLEKVIDGWIKSPKHCENLMRDDFDEVGIAISVNPNSEYGIYWTQELGHKIK